MNTSLKNQTVEQIATGDGMTILLDYSKNGFASKQFIEYIIRKNKLSAGANNASIFSILFLEKVINYGINYHNGSKDELAYFLTDMIPELEFYEASGYVSNDNLTDNAIEEKVHYWKNYEYYLTHTRE